MQTIYRILLGYFILFSSLAVYAQTKPTKPNVILILADDLGWKDLSCYGSTFYETPNLDTLAANGIRFTQSYATSPVCSPTRASIMTGKHPVKTGVTDWIKGRQADGNVQAYEKLIAPATAYQLALEETTIAEYARANNYKTFFAGKWHLGEEEKYWPQHQGFQTNVGGWKSGSPTGKINDTTGGYYTPYKNPMLSDGPKGEYLTNRLTNECLNFIQQNNQAPFLLMYSLYSVHNPLQAPADLIKKYQAKQKALGLTNQNPFEKNEAWMKLEKDWKLRTIQSNATYAAMLENMDWNIGRIIQQLKQLGLYNNTLIIFTSDNGGLSTAEGSPTCNTPLRAGKGWLYEGGIRVPLIFFWKGKMTSVVSNLPVTSADIFPTIATAINANYKKEKNLDGENLFTLLSNTKANEARPLFWHYPHYSNQGGKPGSAIRKGNYKLIYNYDDQSTELYNLSNDVSEQNNLILTNKKIAADLKIQLFNWLKTVPAKEPTPNPNYH